MQHEHIQPRGRTSRIGAIAIAVVLLLAGCSGSDSGGTSDGGSGGDGAAAGDLSGTVRVWTHQNDAFNGGLRTLADSFETANPDVTIEFETFDYDTYIQTLQTSLPAGTEADILQVFGSWTCSYADNLATVPAEVMTVDQAHDVFFSAAVDGYTCDDQLYGMPQEFNIEYGAALVNTAVADEAGVDWAAGWNDWAAFTADAAKLSVGGQGDMTRAGYQFTSSDAIPYTFYSMILQQGGSYLAEDGSTFTIDTPEGAAALAQMQAFVDADLVDPVLYNDLSNWVGDCFYEQTCAMGLVGPWVVADYSGDFPEMDDRTQYAPLPSMGDDPVFAADSGWGLTVSNNSEVADAAWAFVAYVAADEANAAEWNAAAGTLPALKANATGAEADALVAEFPHFATFLPLLEHGRYIGQLPDRDLLWYDITYEHILTFLQGEATAAETLATIESQANDTIG